MKIDQRTREVTLTEAEYYKLVNSPVSEELEDEYNNYIDIHDGEWTKDDYLAFARHFANWGSKHHKPIGEDPCTDCKTETEEICNHCQGFNDKEKCDELVFGRKCPLQKGDNSELTEFEKAIKGLLFDAGDKYDLNTDLDKATKDLAPHFLEAARKQFVEEACNWLYDMWPQIAESPQFIEDFRKALEKGVKDDIK